MQRYFGRRRSRYGRCTCLSRSMTPRSDCSWRFPPSRLNGCEGLSNYRCVPMPPLPPPLNRQSMRIPHSPVCHLQCILKLEISLAIFIADISQLTQLDIFTFLGSFYGLCNTWCRQRCQGTSDIAVGQQRRCGRHSGVSGFAGGENFFAHGAPRLLIT